MAFSMPQIGIVGMLREMPLIPEPCRLSAGQAPSRIEHGLSGNKYSIFRIKAEKKKSFGDIKT